MKTRTEESAFFTVPKNKFTCWQLLIPELKRTSRLCGKHFDEKDIVKGLTIGQDFHPADRWRLTTSALPKHSLGNFLEFLVLFTVSM